MMSCLMNMPTIDVNNLTKTYRVYQKKEGLWQAIRGLGRRKYKQVQAVDGISMQVQQGEFVAFLGPTVLVKPQHSNFFQASSHLPMAMRPCSVMSLGNAKMPIAVALRW